MPRLANLGMYDQPWLATANDALWAAVARRLADAGLAEVPGKLERSSALDTLWRDPDLLLAQTCGYPLMTGLRDAVAVVAAPRYTLPGCEETRHRSFIVVAAGSDAATLAALRGARAAINGRDSNTGMNLFRHAVAPLARDGRFFGSVAVTGSHLASLEAVADGAADAAAIDCVTFGIAARHRPDLTAGVRILSETAPSPALPFVTRADTSPAELAVLREALAAAVADSRNADATAALGLGGIEPATLDDYGIVLAYEEQAAARGYPELA